jgi:hypothetical protein
MRSNRVPSSNPSSLSPWMSLVLSRLAPLLHQSTIGISLLTSPKLHQCTSHGIVHPGSASINFLATLIRTESADMVNCLWHCFQGIGGSCLWHWWQDPVHGMEVAGTHGRRCAYNPFFTTYCLVITVLGPADRCQHSNQGISNHTVSPSSLQPHGS